MSISRDLSLPGATLTSPDHAVHELYRARKARSTKPYRARGGSVARCERCLLPETLCTCSYRKVLTSEASFILLMHDYEVLKPSNSGRLIADLIPDTSAFQWARAEVAPELLSALSQAGRQTYVVFPGTYASPSQRVIEVEAGDLLRDPMGEASNRPVFLLLDGSWREALKMYRKSPYLHTLPILSFLGATSGRYQLRRGHHEFQMSTAEIGVLALYALGERSNAQALEMWFELFVASSILSRSPSSSESEVRRDALIDQLRVAL